VVAVAASAGGVEALSKFVSMLPASFPAAVLVVLHIPPAGTSVLPRILSRAGKLPARHPRDNEQLRAGEVLVAPPDRHLAVEGHRALLLAGPKENGHRPSADVLLRSVAEAFGPRCAGVVLSGTMDDGAAGLRAVRAVGGFALVQDPGQAAFPNMPRAAIEEADPQVIGPVATLVNHLCHWLAELPEQPPESTVSALDPPDSYSDDGTPMTCPECGGTLWLHDNYGAERFRCRVGHSFSADGLALGKRTVLEHALWAAVVALEERADLSRRIMRRLEGSGRTRHLARYREEISTAQRRAEVLRNLIRDLVDEAGTTYDEADDGAGTTARA
jgi:two-component system, chemotaxis family, protein-glutamate methylesterase/glutaminase